MGETASLDSHPTGNLLLNRLPPDELTAINPFLEPVSLHRSDYLTHSNALIENIYFLETGLASIVGAAADNRMVSVGLIGREGVVGATAFLRTKRASHDCRMQLDGTGYCVALDDLLGLQDKTPLLHESIVQFVHTLLVQSAETAACNGIPAIEPRLARFLLMCHDRLDSDELRVTHGILAAMLGVRRASITVALHVLEGEKAIRSLRGQIVILNRVQLEHAARGCYGLAESEYNRIFKPSRENAKMRFGNQKSCFADALP